MKRAEMDVLFMGLHAREGKWKTYYAQRGIELNGTVTISVNARHVICHTLNPHFVICMAS